MERGRVNFRSGVDDMLVPGLQHVGWSQFVDATRGALGAHVHPGAYELCVITRGTVAWWVGDERHLVAPGDCFLTRPDELHGGEHGVMDPCELYWIAFELDPAGGSLGLPAAEIAELDQRLRSLPRRTWPGPESLGGHYDRILAALAAGGALAPTAIRGAIALLLVEALTAAESGHAPTTAPSERTARAIDWMRAHHHQPITLDQVAAAVDLRPSHFRKVFREETGFAPQEYLSRLRLDHAKDLLASSDRSVTDIALATGFNSSAWFATAFKKHTGFAPRDWRRRERG